MPVSFLNRAPRTQKPPSPCQPQGPTAGPNATEGRSVPHRERDPHGHPPCVGRGSEEASLLLVRTPLGQSSAERHDWQAEEGAEVGRGLGRLVRGPLGLGAEAALLRLVAGRDLTPVGQAGGKGSPHPRIPAAPSGVPGGGAEVGPLPGRPLPTGPHSARSSSRPGPDTLRRSSRWSR